MSDVPAPPSADQPLDAPASDATAPLEAAWKNVVSHWEDPAAHKAFVVLAAQLDQLPDAARRYREAKSDGELVAVDGYRVPGDRASRSEVAERGLQLVLAQALARFESVPREDRPKAGRLALPLAALMMLFGLSFGAANMTGKREFLSLPALAAQVLLVAIVPWRKIQRS